MSHQDAHSGHCHSLGAEIGRPRPRPRGSPDPPPPPHRRVRTADPARTVDRAETWPRSRDRGRRRQQARHGRTGGLVRTATRAAARWRSRRGHDTVSVKGTIDGLLDFLDGVERDAPDDVVEAAVGLYGEPEAYMTILESHPR